MATQRQCVTEVKQGSKSDKVEESGRISEKEKKTRSPSGTRDSLREVAQFSFGDSDLLSEEQLDAIEYYNTALVPLGWLPVTKISKGLEKALDQFDGDDIRELVGAVIDDSPSVAIPTRRTLVRLLRDNC